MVCTANAADEDAFKVAQSFKLLEKRKFNAEHTLNREDDQKRDHKARPNLLG